MTDDRHEAVSRRAYELWEKEGGAHGRHEDHWHQASGELEAEAGAKPAKTPKTSAAAKPAAAKPAAAKPAATKSATAKSAAAKSPDAAAPAAKPPKSKTAK